MRIENRAMKLLRGLGLAIIACHLHGSLRGAIVYGVQFEPFNYTYSGAPITQFNSTAARLNEARGSDDLGVRLEVVNAGGPANRVSALRQETIVISAFGPIQLDWVVEFDIEIDGTYQLGGQSNGFIQSSVYTGGTAGPGGLAGATLRRQTGRSFNEFTSGSFLLSDTVILPIPVVGFLTVGLQLAAGANNNAIVNAMHSLRFGGARVVSSTTGLRIAGATITSESGYDWTASLDGASEVPEPSSLALAASAGAFLLWRRPRRF